MMARDEVDEDMVDNHYTRPHWARATTETSVKIKEKKETVVALIDSASIRMFVQDSASHPIILGQPYITSSEMETKVFNNGVAFALVTSLDGKKVVQFSTIRANHERNQDCLGEDASDF